tara:strand:+ start:224 stop:424 length:201 start_codon:yes stop_codon:yes gene_type:complete
MTSPAFGLILVVLAVFLIVAGIVYGMIVINRKADEQDFQRDKQSEEVPTQIVKSLDISSSDENTES